MLLTCYAVAMLLLWLGTAVYLVAGSRKIDYLNTVAPLTTAPYPSVAVIIAVKDEEAEVEEALCSVCNLRYPNFRIYVINDRSTDNTPQILHRMSRQNSQLQLITITQLPEGWLGKNNALYQGYLASTEEWLLFTDADVKYAPDALSKAMQCVQQHRLHHLTTLPQITSHSWLFKAVVTTFALMLNMKLRPWNAINPSSDASVGVGAFNLVKRSSYQKAGTHTAISLRPDDDLKLGERIKNAGLRQMAVYGDGEVWLQWYTGLAAFIKGLMKNTFSVANYNLALAFAMATTTFLLLVLPVPLLLFCGWPYLLLGGAILLSQVVVMLLAKGINARWWYALLIPFAGSIMVYIIVQSSLLTIRQGGIYWRSSFYSLKDLKKQA